MVRFSQFAKKRGAVAENYPDCETFGLVITAVATPPKTKSGPTNIFLLSAWMTGCAVMVGWRC